VIVEVVVATGKKEQARAWSEIDNGAIVAHGDGLPATPADVTFTATPGDAQALHDGALDLSVGFMRGQVKMAGDFGWLLQLLPLTAGPMPAIQPVALLPS
jgi:hypothetical protein